MRTRRISHRFGDTPFKLSLRWAMTLSAMGATVSLSAYGEYGVGHHAVHHAHHAAAQFASMPAFMQTMGSVMYLNKAMQSAMKNPLDDNRRVDVQNAARNLQGSVIGLNSQFQVGSLDASQVTAVQGALAGAVDKNLTGPGGSDSGTSGSSSGKSDTSTQAGGNGGGNPTGVGYAADGQSGASLQSLTSASGDTSGAGGGTTPLPGAATSASGDSGAAPGAGASAGGFFGEMVVLGGGAGNAAGKEDAFGKGIGATDTTIDKGDQRMKDESPASAAGGSSSELAAADLKSSATAPTEDLLGSLEAMQALGDGNHAKPLAAMVGASAAKPKEKVAAASRKHDPFALTDAEKRHTKKSPFTLARLLGIRRPATATVGTGEIGEPDGQEPEEDDSPWTRVFWITSIVLNLSLITYKVLPLIRQWREKGRLANLPQEAVAEATPIRTTWIR